MLANLTFSRKSLIIWASLTAVIAAICTLLMYLLPNGGDHYFKGMVVTIIGSFFVFIFLLAIENGTHKS